MRFLVYALVALAIALTSLASLASDAGLFPYGGAHIQLAQERIPDPTQDQIDSARGFAQFRERVLFNQALFGMGNIPDNCVLELKDPSREPERFNFVLFCDGPIDICNARGVQCPNEDEGP